MKIDYEKIKEITVKTQEELDDIPEDFEGQIYIEFGARYIPAIVTEKYCKRVIARGNANVDIRFDSEIIATENSRITAFGNSKVIAMDNSVIAANGNSNAVVMGNSFIILYDESSVIALEESGVFARDNSSVVAMGNSEITATGNSKVIAMDNSDVEIWDDAKMFDIRKLMMKEMYVLEMIKKIPETIEELKNMKWKDNHEYDAAIRNLTIDDCIKIIKEKLEINFD